MLRIGNGFGLKAPTFGARVCKSPCSNGPFTRRVIVCGAGFDPNPSTQKKTNSIKDDVNLDDAEIEERLLERRMRRRQKAEPADAGFKVDTDAVPSEANAELETRILYVLSSLFGLIIVNGIVIAASGFLPESVDSFIEKVLYPSFSPLVLVFLACSTLYGIWKTRGQKETDA